MRLLPGVRYENTVDSLGMSFGTDVPNVGGARRDWSNVIVDGVVANEVGASEPDGAADQPRRDRRSQGAAELLPRGVRARRRRPGADRQQERRARDYHGNLYYYGRHEALNANNFFNNRSGVKKPRYRFNTYGANLGGPVPGLNGSRRSCSSSTRWKPRWSAGPGRRGTGRCRPTPRCRGTSRRRWTAAGQLINIKDPQRTGACNAATGGPGCFPGNIIPRQPHQLERRRAAEHAAARQQLRPDLHAGAVQLYDAGERREPEDEQHRAGGLAAVGATTASTSPSRTGTRTSAAARSPPARRSGASSTPTT